MTDRYVLGIDTSNYKTSVAVIDREYKIIYDARQFLSVKRGDRGLRQSEALFQHVQTLPQLLEKVPVDLAGHLDGIAWSDRPRPVEGSYMPVFLAGESTGRALASVNGVMGVGFSHQEGHIEAICSDLAFHPEEPFLACHFSGGTTEILLVTPRKRNVVLNSRVFYDIQIIGGTKDISYGQVLDRAGVAMGMSFPSGEAMDQIACRCQDKTEFLTKIKVMNAYVNLSGIETQIKRVLEDGRAEGIEDPFICEIFWKLSDSVAEALSQAMSMTGIDHILMAGGVSSSRFIREHLKNSRKLEGGKVLFGEPSLSQDNAVGTAMLGGRYLWD